ncbi:MAG: DMT family transporter, partial [Natronospirillum sp.]
MHQGALKSDLWLVLVTVFAALGWVFSAEALVGMTPLLFIGVRFLLAGLLLMVAGGRPLQRLTRLDWRNALLTGAVMGVAMSFWIMGLATADNLGVGAFLASLGVVFVPIVGRLLFGSATTASTWVAVGVAVIGLACLRVEDGFSLSGSDVFFLLAALSFSVLKTVMRGKGKRHEAKREGQDQSVHQQDWRPGVEAHLVSGAASEASGD